MGYETSYRLEIEPYTDDNWCQVWEILSNNEDATYALDGDGDINNSCKWYDHEEDLLEISRVLPDIMFILYGEGEDSGDIWIKNFQNGKIQRRYAVITYPSLTVDGWVEGVK